MARAGIQPVIFESDETRGRIWMHGNFFPPWNSPSTNLAECVRPQSPEEPLSQTRTKDEQYCRSPAESRGKRYKPPNQAARSLFGIKPCTSMLSLLNTLLLPDFGVWILYIQQLQSRLLLVVRCFRAARDSMENKVQGGGTQIDFWLLTELRRFWQECLIGFSSSEFLSQHTSGIRLNFRRNGNLEQSSSMYSCYPV